MRKPAEFPVVPTRGRNPSQAGGLYERVGPMRPGCGVSVLWASHVLTETPRVCDVITRAWETGEAVSRRTAQSPGLHFTLLATLLSSPVLQTHCVMHAEFTVVAREGRNLVTSLPCIRYLAATTADNGTELALTACPPGAGHCPGCRRTGCGAYSVTTSHTEPPSLETPHSRHATDIYFSRA